VDLTNPPKLKNLDTTWPNPWVAKDDDRQTTTCVKCRCPCRQQYQRVWPRSLAATTWWLTLAGRSWPSCVNGPITIAIRARFEYDSSTIQLQHATTRYEVFRALAYDIDSSTPRESVVGVSCMLIDSSMHTIFTLHLYRPTLHRVCAWICQKLFIQTQLNANMPSIQLFTVKL